MVIIFYKELIKKKLKDKWNQRGLHKIIKKIKTKSNLKKLKSSHKIL